MEEEKNSKKLSYEQLEAYAQQTTARAQQIFKENQILKQALNSKDIENALKCLDHAELFSAKFIENITSRIEELLDPDREETDTKESKEEN
jgi:hypothetical protein